MLSFEGARHSRSFTVVLINRSSSFCFYLDLGCFFTHSLFSFYKHCLTSACIQQLGSFDEAQVTRPSPKGLRIPEAEFGVEVICLQALLSIDGIVAAGAVGGVHPDLWRQKGGKLFNLCSKSTLLNLFVEPNIKKIYIYPEQQKLCPISLVLLLADANC